MTESNVQETGIASWPRNCDGHVTVKDIDLNKYMHVDAHTLTLDKWQILSSHTQACTHIHDHHEMYTSW